MPDIPVTPPQLIGTNTFGSYSYTVSGDGADTFTAPPGTTSTNVKVYVGGLEVASDDTYWSWSFDNGDVTFDSPPPNGESVTIERNVFLDFQKTGFPPGYILDARVLNRIFQQALYQSQEVVEVADYTEIKWDESSLLPAPPNESNTYLIVTEAGGWDPKLKTVVKGNIFNLANNDDVLFNNEVSCTASVSSTDLTTPDATFDIVSATNVSSTIVKTFIGVADDVRDLVMNSLREADAVIRSDDDTHDGLSLDGSGIWLAPDAYYYPETVVGGQSTELETYPHTGFNIDASGQLYAPLSTRLTYNDQAGAYTVNFTKNKLDLTEQNVILGDTNGRIAKDDHSEPKGNIRANNVPDMIGAWTSVMLLKDNVLNSGASFGQQTMNKYYGVGGGPGIGGFKGTHNKVEDIRRITDYSVYLGSIGNYYGVVTRPCFWVKCKHKISTRGATNIIAQVSQTLTDSTGTNSTKYLGSEARVFVGGSTAFNAVRDEWNAISIVNNDGFQIGQNPEYEMIIYPDRNLTSQYTKHAHVSANTPVTPLYDSCSERVIFKVFVEEDHSQL